MITSKDKHENYKVRSSEILEIIKCILKLVILTNTVFKFSHLFADLDYVLLTLQDLNPQTLPS
jgi:hypothetical protein